MSIFAHLFLLVLGWYTTSLIYKLELRRYRFGSTGFYVKVRKDICSEKDFIAMLKMSIFKSFLFRFVFIGFLGGMIYAYYILKVEGEPIILGDLGTRSGLDYLGLWVYGSMILMANRANKAIIYGTFGPGDWKVELKNSAEPITQTLAKIERKIKLGFYSYIIALGSVIITAITLDGGSGDYQFLYYAFFTLCAAIVCVTSFWVWKKSRIANTLMLLFFLTFNYYFPPADNEWLYLIYGIFIIVSGIAMMASYDYHKITKFISNPDTSG